MAFFRQHDRLRVPQSWQGESRAFVAQLEKLLDILFNRKIESTDLKPDFLSSIFMKKAKVLDRGDECNDQTESGLYYIRQDVAHTPVEWAGMIVINSGHAEGRDIYQIIFNEKGLWVRDYSGAPPSTAWKPWRKLRCSYVDGEQGSAESQVICYGHVTGDGKRIQLMVPMPKDVPSKSVTLSSLKIELCGPSGYVDIFTSTNLNTEKIGTSGYTFSAYGIGGMLRVQIDKTSAFTNITNNTPITGHIAAASFTVPS